MKYYVVSVGSKTFACFNESCPCSYEEAFASLTIHMKHSTSGLRYVLVAETSYYDVRKVLEAAGKEQIG